MPPNNPAVISPITMLEAVSAMIRRSSQTAMSGSLILATQGHAAISPSDQWEQAQLQPLLQHQAQASPQVVATPSLNAQRSKIVQAQVTVPSLITMPAVASTTIKSSVPTVTNGFPISAIQALDVISL